MVEFKDALSAAETLSHVKNVEVHGTRSKSSATSSSSNYVAHHHT